MPAPASATTPTTCPFPARACVERRLQRLHVRIAADEAGEPPRAGGVEARPVGARPLELEDAHGIAHPLDGKRAQVLQLEVPLHQPGGRRAQVDRVGRGQLLHARGEPDRVSLGGVVHAQVVADLAHHDLAGVDPDAHREGEPVLALHLPRVAPELVAQMQRRVARPLGVVLVGDRRTEERHDPVAGVLVDRALEAVDAVRQDLEEAVQDPVPLLGVDLLGQLHRALHVGEEHGDLLALAFQGGLRLEDLVGEVLRGVVAGSAFGSVCWSFLDAGSALIAEASVLGQLRAAAWADRREPRSAGQAELRLLTVRFSAARTDHMPSSFASLCACPVAPISV